MEKSLSFFWVNLRFNNDDKNEIMERRREKKRRIFSHQALPDGPRKVFFSQHAIATPQIHPHLSDIGFSYVYILQTMLLNNKKNPLTLG